MGLADRLYLIDKNLGATVLADRLGMAAHWLDLPPRAPGADLAYSADRTLAPGVVYPAGDGSPRAFALPTYTLAETGGRYDTALKWLADATPGSAIARLTIMFAATLPAAPAGVTLTALDHGATARLLYRVPVEGADASAPLSLDLGAVNAAGDGRASVALDLHTKAEFDRLWSIMTSPASEARLEVRCVATIGVRTWRQLIPERVRLADQVELLNRRDVLLTELITPPKVAPGPPPKGRRPLAIDRAVLASRRAAFATVAAASPVTITAAPGVQLAHQLRIGPVGRLLWRRPEVNVVAGATTVSRAVTLPRAFATAFQNRVAVTDMVPLAAEVRAPAIRQGMTRFPFHAFVDKTGRPALVALRAEALQTLPFAFDVSVNAYMFDVPGDLRPNVTRVFLRDEYNPGGDRAPLVFYQDSAFPARFYYEPQEFRIPRADAPPHLPELRLAFYDLVEDGGDDADPAILYRTRVAYRAVPFVDRAVLEGLRRRLRADHPDAALSALLPEDLHLSLRLPGEDGGLAEVAREAATITLDDGIVDEIELTPGQLAAFVTMLRTGGVDGTVAAAIPGATATGIPVRLSLREPAGVLTDRAYRGPVGDGRVRVSIANRIESPITLAALYATPIEGGATAFPQTMPGIALAPGAAGDLDYTLDPPTAAPLDLDPLVTCVVDADLEALLPSVMENRGYASDTFTVPVSVDPDYFGRTMPGESEPLTGVRVEFEGDDVLVLSAAAPAADARLRLPMLDWLMKRSGAARYRSRIINLHGTDAPQMGATGPWTDGAGEGALSVVPVGA